MTELEDEKVRKNDILSHREKSLRPPGQGLDGKGVRVDEIKDDPANSRPSKDAGRFSMSDPETLSLTSLIGNAVNNADAERVGTTKDILVNRTGTIAAILLDTGGILGVGKKTVVVPFTECAIIGRDETALIVLPHLHSGEVLVAPEYQVPGGTPLERITHRASAISHAAMTRAGGLSEQAAAKTAEFGKKAVDRATQLAHKGADKVTDLVHKGDDR